MICIAAVMILSAVLFMSGCSKEETGFYGWLKQLSAEDITYAQVFTGEGASRLIFDLGEDEKEELVSILNHLSESEVYKDAFTSLGNQTLYLKSDMESNMEEYWFYLMDDGKVYLMFDSETRKKYAAEETEQDLWHIENKKLAGFVTSLIEDQGKSPFEKGEYIDTDLDHDGVRERITVSHEGEEWFYTIAFADGKELRRDLTWEEYGWFAEAVCSMNGKDYLLTFDTKPMDGMNCYSMVLYDIFEEKIRKIGEVQVPYDGLDDAETQEKVEFFFSGIQDYIDSSIVLFHTHDGETMERGPVSAEKLKNKIFAVHDNLKKIVPFEETLTEVLPSLDGESFTCMDRAGNVTAEAFTDALKNAAANEVTLEEAVKAGYQIEGGFTWNLEAYFEGDLETEGISWNDLHIRAECSFAEDLVKVWYGKAGSYDVTYYRDEALYQLIRHKGDREYYIDRTAFSRFEEILTKQMELHFNSWKSNPGEIIGYELLDFYLVYSYEEKNSVVELYDFDYALLPKYPDQVPLAGGTQFDSQLRLRGFNGGGQLAVRYRDGEMTAYSFMGNDFYYAGEEVDWFDGYEKQQKDRLKSALDYAEKNKGLIQ